MELRPPAPGVLAASLRAMPPLRPATWALVAALAAVTVVHLAAQLLERDALSDVTQVALMPLLAGALLAQAPAPRDRRVTGTLVALGLSWLGDAVPRLLDGDAAFLAMVGFFLLAQLSYIAAFWPDRSTSVAGRRRWLVAPYAVLTLVLVALCADEAGALLPAIAVYAGCLATMAVLATGVHRWAAVGGVVFLLSDGLIAVDAFTSLAPPASSFWVMLTYVVGQTLLSAGVLARHTDRSRGGDRLPTAGRSKFYV